MATENSSGQNSASQNSSGQNATSQKTAQEALVELENTYQEKATKLNEAKQQLAKHQETIIHAQDELFVALQQLATHKERMLVNIIGQHQQQIKSLTPTSSVGNLPTIKENPVKSGNLNAAKSIRPDNLEAARVTVENP